MKNIFKRNRTKWIPFGHYVFDNSDYIVLARKNTSTGMLYFKTIRASSTVLTRLYFPNNIIDTLEQWNLLTEDFLK